MKKGVTEANGVSIVLNEEMEYATQALQNKFSEHSKSKPKKVKKNIYMYSSVLMPEICENPLDYYYRVEPVNKKEGGKSRVTLFLSPGNKYFWASDKYPKEIQGAMRMLRSLTNSTATFRMAADITTQKEVVDKALDKQKELEREAGRLAKEKEKLEEQLVKIEKQIEENLEAQSKHKTTVEVAKKRLDDMEERKDNMR